MLRGVAAVGGGGVLYLTPMVFHRASLSASDLGVALACAALLGTLSRLTCGMLLDRGFSTSLPVALAAVAALAGDGLLLSGNGLGAFLPGLLLQGFALGLYWPAIELAVALCCEPIPSSRAYALVRSADAAGVALGALLGAGLAALQQLRGIYAVDMLMLALLLLLLRRRPLPAAASGPFQRRRGAWHRLLPPLLPLLLVSVLATAMPALMQSALPLDLVRGGLAREPMAESLGASLIGLQLALLMLLQWPLGRWLARKPVARGLGLSLICCAVGCLLLAASALSPHGLLLVVLAQLPLALGEAAFLPVATEAVVELAPSDQRGLAMALFSQCFAVSALLAPLIAGWMLDRHGHGAVLWLLTALACLLGLWPVAALGAQQRRRLLRVLSGEEHDDGSGVLFRFEEPSEPGSRGDDGSGRRSGGTD
ncbi:MAG: MFS transporter [Synechococcaceae cyanobacterium]|nr:MFS transporter [Synechococcaceae cyanobacterium]